MFSRLLIVASNAVFAAVACVLVVACFVVVERSAAAGHDYYYAIQCDNKRPNCDCNVVDCGARRNHQCSNKNPNTCQCLQYTLCACDKSISPMAC